MVPQHSAEGLARILQLCRNSGDRLQSVQLQALLHKNDMEIHLLQGNRLVPMLVEAGNIHDAHQLFDMLLHRNEYSWTSLIAGYVQSSRPQHALALYEDMLKDGAVNPSGHTFLALLKACTKLKRLKKGSEIHCKINELGLSQKDVFVGSALLDMYSKCGSPMRAQQVFDKLLDRNVVCWNALISGYVECGQAKEALCLFWEMQDDGTRPDAVTFTCSLKACSKAGAINEGRKLHFEVERQGLLETDVNVGNALIAMYAKCGFPVIANEVFNKLPEQDVVSWTALIAGHAEHGHAEQALSYFDLMRENGVFPNAITYICCLKACASLHALTKGREIHADIETQHSIISNPAVVNSLVDMYAKCGVLSKAKELFDTLTNKDVVAWASLISGYAEHGYGEKLVDCFEQMELDGVHADATLFVSMLKGCIKIRALDKGLSIHGEIERRGLLRENLHIGNAVVDMYAKLGLTLKSRQVFDRLPARDLVSWNTY